MGPCQFESLCEEDTLAFARRIGAGARPGEIYCLDGDLGTGKTVFARGFAEGLGIMEPITSPTFTIVKEYEDGRLPLYHFDVYRIADPDEMDAIGYEDYFYGTGVCLIEWSELIQELLPKNAWHIRIEKNPLRGFDFRHIELSEGKQ